MLEITFSDVVSAELTNRLLDYNRILADTPVAAYEAKREVCNHRYICLQWALYQHSGGQRPATSKTDEEVREELQRWIGELQKNATIETARSIGRTIDLVKAFLNNTPPVATPAEQINLL